MVLLRVKSLGGNDFIPRKMKNRCGISNFIAKSPGRAVQRSSILSTRAAASVGTRALIVTGMRCIFREK
jgi:hypothetical protein